MPLKMKTLLRSCANMLMPVDNSFYSSRHNDKEYEKGQNGVIIFMMMKRAAHYYTLSFLTLCVCDRINVKRIKCDIYSVIIARKLFTWLSQCRCQTKGCAFFHLSRNTKSQTGMETITHIHKIWTDRARKKKFLITELCDVMMWNGHRHQMKRSKRTYRTRKSMFERNERQAKPVFMTILIFLSRQFFFITRTFCLFPWVLAKWYLRSKLGNRKCHKRWKKREKKLRVSTHLCNQAYWDSSMRFSTIAYILYYV